MGSPVSRNHGHRRVREHRWRPQLAGERGSVSVELSIAFPVVLLLLMVLIQSALWFYARSAALGAAEEGARVGRLPPASTARATAAAQDFLTRTSHDLLHGTAVETSDSATLIRVEVTGTSVSLFPGLPGWPVDQSAAGPVERPSR